MTASEIPPKVTSKDVAKLAKVSQSTVSYVLTGKRPISAETRERVLAAIETLTFEPNARARALASQRSRVIGLMVPIRVDDTNDSSGYLPFVTTLASAARTHDHDLLVVTADQGSAGLSRLAGRSICDAILLMDVEANDERIPVAEALGVPVVLIGVPDEPKDLHCVDVDHALAAQMAVDELVDTGHDQIVLMGYTSEVIARDLNFVRRFINSAQAAAAKHGIPLEIVAPVDATRDSAHQAVDRALTLGKGKRLGLLVANLPALPLLLNALWARNIVPGKDVSVIGLCTDAMAAQTEPPLTNLSLEPRDVSLRAIHAVFSALGLTDPEDASPQIELLQPRLTRRHSVMS